MQRDFICNDKPIFLHFLNREICETENIRLNDDELYSMVLIALLSTTSYVYVGHALVLENMIKYPKTISLLMSMEKWGYVYLVGNDFNVNNYISRRQELYRYDKKKYSMYFQDNIEKLPWPNNPIITYVDTTNILYETFVKIANDIKVDDEFSMHKISPHDKNRLGKRMDYQKQSKVAVTKALFNKTMISNAGKEDIRKLIIQIYNRRYCDEFNGTYLTGIPGLTYYDQFEKTGLFYNYIILREFFKALRILSEYYFCENEKLLCLFENRYYGVLLNEVRRFLSGICKMNYSIPQTILFIRSCLKNQFAGTDSCEDIIIKLLSISNSLKKNNYFFKEGYDVMSEENKRILIISASVLEYRVLRECAIKNGYTFTDVDTNLDEFSYAECLTLDEKKIFLARTDMGALNAAHTIDVLNRTINPDFVIVGGICVGLRKKEQKLAQLLISKQIHDYDLQKVANGNRILRGTTIPANRYLYDKCILECYDMPDDEYDEGLIISANILVNDREMINQMVKDKPDAIGYEMEGAGISYICNIFNNRWIMIKGISDWGFKKGNSHQQEAALKSYEFIFKLIKKRMIF